MTGSRLEVWPGLDPAVYLARPAPQLPFPLDDTRGTLFSRARHALVRGVEALGLERGDEVLAPAYHHGSEIEALLRAGLICRFYEATHTLEPDADELESLLGPRVRALHLTHYVGFPQDAARWRRWCDERGLLLLEDAAQAWLASLDGAPLGSFADLAVFCLYKTLPIPEGAALVLSRALDSVSSERRIRTAGVARLHAGWLLARSERLTRFGRRLQAEAADTSGVDMALGDPLTPPSAETLFLIRRLVTDEVAARRRANYELLASELHELIPRPFGDVPAGASPFVLPVQVQDADTAAELRERLLRAGIVAPKFWAIAHPSLPTRAYPRATARRENVLALPVHQGLRSSDLERIVTVAVPRRRGASLELELVDDPDAMRDEWAELAARSGNVFASWEWVSTWWRHFGADRERLVVACRTRGGDLRAIVPLYYWSKRPARIIRFLGHGPGDELGPICDPSDRPVVARALRRFLANAPFRWDVILAEQLAGDASWAAALGAQTLRREGNPVLRIAGRTWEEFLASKSPNFRQQVRRLERNLISRHGMTYRLAAGGQSLQADLDTLFELHAARWSTSETAFGSRRESFHRDFAALADDRDWVRLWFLEIEERPVAALYGFRFSACDCFYQAGRDPAWDHASVGVILLAHTIREAFADGLAAYRLLRGGEGYKYRFATSDPGLETVALSQGVLGTGAVAAGRTITRSRRLKRALREPLGA